MCSLRKCELFLCISKCDWGVLHTSNRSGTSIEIKFDSKIKLTHLINVWREWDKERNTRLIHSHHVWWTCVCEWRWQFLYPYRCSVCKWQTRTTVRCRLVVFMSVALLFLRTCIFFLFVDTKHCIVPWNNEWALNKCNTFKDWTRLKMTIDRQSIRSTLDALALEIVSSHVCAC